jgi:hypothetical protein
VYSVLNSGEKKIDDFAIEPNFASESKVYKENFLS